MAATLITQAAGNESADAQLTGVPSGATIIVAARERDGNTLSVSDDQNGAHTEAVSVSTIGSRAGVWFFHNSAAGTLNLTVTGGSVRDYNASAWTGLQAIAADTTGTASTVSGTSHPHGSVTPSASALLMTAMGCGSHGGLTQHTGFTALTVNPTGSAVDRQNYSYKISHTGTINPTITSVNTIFSDTCVAAFLESGASFDPATLGWSPRYEVRRGVKAVMVPSGMTPPDQND
jgi:hypothetical protein